MKLGISGRSALVTGASRGIGFAIAKGLAAEGVRVVLNARNQKALQEAVGKIRLEGGYAYGEAADISDLDQIKSLFKRTQKLIGSPDIVISNAGGPKVGTVESLEEEDWLGAFNLTFMSTVRLTRMALPAMRKQGWGRIINVTSISVKEPVPGLALSNAYRAAVTSYAKTLANEIASEGITVNGVGPGYTATERIGEVVGEGRAMETLKATVPLKRFASPDEVAAVCVFLASQQAGYLTGQTIFADGGFLSSVH
jgi:3-oxoacyl-[acyl-carrier protein] reductase